MDAQLFLFFYYKNLKYSINVNIPRVSHHYVKARSLRRNKYHTPLGLITALIRTISRIKILQAHTYWYGYQDIKIHFYNIKFS